jgi:hypothetical protein
MKKFFEAVRTTSEKKPIEFLTLLTAIASIVFLGWQLFELNDTLESQAYSYILSGLHDLDKTFVENAEYRQYFQENIDLPPESAKRQKIWALADAKLDFIDSFYSQEGHINWNKYTKDGWEEFFRESFKCSLVMRKSFCRDRTQYGHQLLAFTARMCEAGKPTQDPQWTQCAAKEW